MYFVLLYLHEEIIEKREVRESDWERKEDYKYLYSAICEVLGTCSEAVVRQITLEKFEVFKTEN